MMPEFKNEKLNELKDINFMPIYMSLFGLNVLPFYSGAETTQKQTIDTQVVNY